MALSLPWLPHAALSLHPRQQAKRIGEHRAGIIPGFTARYGVKRLVYLEAHSSMTEAIRRERQMKEWQRLWKLRLIERDNPRWRDLFVELFEG